MNFFLGDLLSSKSGYCSIVYEICYYTDPTSLPLYLYFYESCTSNMEDMEEIKKIGEIEKINKIENIEAELATIRPICCKDSCCKSHLTSKGRCFDCPNIQ